MAKWDTNTLRIAVTGVGGGCGQGILKALSMAKLPKKVEIYPVDVTPVAVGLHMGIGGGTVLPYPEKAFDEWRRWAVNWNITAIIPGSDHDLTTLAAYRDAWQTDYQIRLLVNPLFACEVSNDKLLTVQVLNECGVDVPMSYGGEPDANIPYWLKKSGTWVVKPRFGMASRDVHIASSEAETVWYWHRVENAVLQEYIEGDEYTCAMFFDKQSCLRACFAMRRWMRGGDTHRAEAGDFPDVVTYLHEFAGKTRERFRWQGAVNIQLKKNPERGCIPFEINARCSGSTAMRAAFGYNEPEMLIRHYVLGEPVEQPETRKGMAQRYSDILILPNLDDDGLNALTRGIKGTKIQL